jgi:hypothetical protein
MYLSVKDQKSITSFFQDMYQVPPDCIQRGMHLTIYHSRIPLNSYKKGGFPVSINIDVGETRLMVLAPGGENSRPNLIPAKRSVGIRLTKRNSAIPEILTIRRDAFIHEPPFGKRKNTTDWRNAFGARHYQPHLKLLRPGNGLDFDLTQVGDVFRDHFDELNFSKVAVKEYVN